ncbi:hypothetical protein SB00610_00659 [Klebsiella quasipneumoniae subsp. similipneumoniae]|nr:hypothetical protein SB00610_00659 [Klebsiella quasipneumoniae subsp. similipneumoniae]
MHQIKRVIAADARHIEIFRENQHQQNTYRQNHLIARQRIDDRRLRFALIHPVLCGVPAADLRQHDDSQQGGQYEPGDVAFTIRGDDHRRQQRTKRTAEVAADLEQRLGQAVTAAGGHPRYAGRFRMENRGAGTHQRGGQQHHTEATSQRQEDQTAEGKAHAHRQRPRHRSFIGNIANHRLEQR